MSDLSDRLDAAIKFVSPDHITPLGARQIRAAVLDALGDDPAQAKVEAVWQGSLPNDGEYEYSATGDCAGTWTHFLRRRPALHAEPGAWERCEAIPDTALYPWRAALDLETGQ